jgi:hypothetical protein
LYVIRSAHNEAIVEVFISSLIGGYERYRAAAHEAVETLGHQVVRAEDFPASAGTPRIVVWFGDAPGHDPVCTAITGSPADITEASVIGKLVAEAISVLAISLTGGTDGLDADPTFGASDYDADCGPPAGVPGQASRITTATGGTLVPGIDDTTIVNTIITLVSGAVATLNNVSLVPDAVLAPFVTGISPAGGYGPLPLNTDHDLTFTVTFGRGGMECTDP